MSLNRFSRVAGRLNLDHLLVRCAQPDADGFATLRALGIEQIVKLNTEQESPSEYERAQGFVVSQFAVNQQDPTEQDLRQLVALIAGRLAIGSTAVHCTRGRDRTGFAIAGYRVLEQGWPTDSAIDEYRSFGSNIFSLLWDRRMEKIIRGLD